MSSSQYQQVEASDEPTTPLNIESGTSSNNARNVENRDAKGCGSLGTWIYMILTLSMAIAIIFMKLESDHRYTSMQQQIIEMQRQLDIANSNELANLHAFQDSLISKENDFEERTQSSILSLSDIVQKQNRSYNYQYKDIVAKISTHDATLIKLTNGTSNAEVLDKLQWTKDHVANQMSETKAEVVSKIQDVTRNVSLLIEDSHLQLQQTQSSISTFLNSTVNNMRAVMTTATNHIYEVQRNVTHAMNQTKINMERTVIELSQSVLKAQSTIQGEVSEVRDHIEAYVAVTNKQFAAENDFVKYQLAGLFTLMSCLIFLWHLTQHMRHFHKPEIQKRITAILWMVPVYGVTSWISMMQPKAENFLATVRDCYEAYVVYTFVAMLVAILGDGKSLDELEIQIANRITEERREVMAYKAWQMQQRAASAASSSSSSTAIATTTVMDVENNVLMSSSTESETENELLPTTGSPLREPKEHFIPPCPCCYRSHMPLSMAATWLWQCRFLALQFMFIKPLFTVVPLFLQITGLYNVDAIPPWENNTVNWHSAKLYIIAIQNISVGMAFYGLLSFYHGAEKDLEWCDPWPKFLTIKGIVFATFWQSICIQAMSAFGLVDEKAAAQISNFLICVEMLIASIAHFYVFPHHEWHPTYQKQRERTLLIQDTMALRDFVQDMRSMMTSRRAASRSTEVLDDNGVVVGIEGECEEGSERKTAAVGAGGEVMLNDTGSEVDSNSERNEANAEDENENEEEDDEELGVRMSLLPPSLRQASKVTSPSTTVYKKPLNRSFGDSEDEDTIAPLSFGMAAVGSSSSSCAGPPESTFSSPVSSSAHPKHPIHTSGHLQRETDPLLVDPHHAVRSAVTPFNKQSGGNSGSSAHTPHQHRHTPHHHSAASGAPTGAEVSRYVQEQLEKKLQQLEAIEAASPATNSSNAAAATSTGTGSNPSSHQKQHASSPAYYQQGDISSLLATRSPFHPPTFPTTHEQRNPSDNHTSTSQSSTRPHHDITDNESV